MRHMTLLREAAGAARPQVLARAARARLPPSAVWLFTPREETHNRGGWNFRWAKGADKALTGQESHVFLLLAAFESLDLEAKLGRPKKSWWQWGR